MECLGCGGVDRVLTWLPSSFEGATQHKPAPSWLGRFGTLTNEDGNGAPVSP